MPGGKAGTEKKPLIRRTAIIGLGGTGVSTILHIKKILHQYYRQIPLSVSFLALDTTQNQERALRFRLDGKWQTVRLEPHEFFYLPVANPLEVIQASPSISEWWPEQLPTRAITMGAGGIRAVGRLGFCAHAAEIMEWMEKTLHSLSDLDLGRKMREEQGLDLVDRADVEVYVISSLSGGTGSGSFLDVGFMARHLMRGLVTKIYGFFLLPRVFGGLPATARRNANAYAALKEMDYYMGLDYRFTRPVFHYGLKEVEASLAPYDIVNLVDGKNENGKTVLGPGGQKGVENLCELVAMGIGLNVGSVGKVQDDVLDNLSNLIGTQNAQNWGGKNARYSSFGVSAIVYPVEKHFNQFYSIFCLNLIEDGLKAVRRRAETDADPARIGDDLQSFLTQERLRAEADNVIDDLIKPAEIDTDIGYPEGYSVEEVKTVSDDEKRRIGRTIENELENNLVRKLKEAEGSLETALKTREREKGADYAMRFAEKLAAAMETYREKRTEEIETHEEEVRTIREEAERLLHQAREMGVLARLRKKPKEALQGYLNQVSSEMQAAIEIQRKRAALKVFKALTEGVKDYIAGLNLSAAEKALSLAKIQVEKDIFRTTYLPVQYGSFTLIAEPRRAVVESGSGSKGRAITFQEFIAERGIVISFQDFLDRQGLRIGDIAKTAGEKLLEALVTYSMDKMATIQEMSIEKVLTYDAGDDRRGQLQKLKDCLKEASERAAPLWFHGATAEFASQMEELFIIGVEHESASIFKTAEWGADLLPYLRSQANAYPPNFTSTMDPHKLFFFKYKAPLPAYLLRDMEQYREEYDQLPIDMTPHIQKQMELKIPGLFPEPAAYKRALRIFALAASPGFNLIKSKMDFHAGEANEMYSIDRGDLGLSEPLILGKSRVSAFEELQKPGRTKIQDKLADRLNAHFENDQAAAGESLRRHIEATEEVLRRAVGSRLESDRDAAPLKLGELILRNQEMQALKHFCESGKGISDFLVEGLR
jgi:hypothetical protein